MSFLIFLLIIVASLSCCLWSFCQLLHCLNRPAYAAVTYAERHIPSPTGDELMAVADALAASPYSRDFLCPKASDDALRVLHDDGPCSELKFFAMVVMEQTDHYRHELLMRSRVPGALTIACPEDLLAWHRQMMGYMQHASAGYTHLINERLPVACEATEPTALHDLALAYAYLHCRLQCLMQETQSAQTTRQCRETLVRMANVYADAIGQVARFPLQVMECIEQRLAHPEVDTLQTLTLSLSLDQGLMDKLTAQVLSLCREWDYGCPAYSVLQIPLTDQEPCPHASALSARAQGIKVTIESKRDQILRLLDECMEGKTGKEATMVILAAVRAGAIEKPSYAAFVGRYQKLVNANNYYLFTKSDYSYDHDTLQFFVDKFKALITE